jgi:hypothetical protein
MRAGSAAHRECNMSKYLCCLVALAILLVPAVSDGIAVKHLKLAHSGTCVSSSSGKHMVSSLGRTFPSITLRQIPDMPKVAISGSEGFSTSEASVGLEQAFVGLGSVYPNPFSPSTSITYMLDTPCHVSISIYDASGRLVRTLVNETMEPGKLHTVVWNGADDSGRAVHGGVYFCRYIAHGQSQNRKLVLLD